LKTGQNDESPAARREMLGFWKQMSKTLHPFHFLLLSVAGWMNQKQQCAIEYLREENRVPRAQLGGRWLRFTDDQRRSLAVKARLLGRKMLAEMACHPRHCSAGTGN
jgi:hypothetical protein